MSITKEMTIGEVLDKYKKTEKVLKGFGMHCLGCPASRGESLEEAAEVHDIDIEELMKALNGCVE